MSPSLGEVVRRAGQVNRTGTGTRFGRRRRGRERLGVRVAACLQSPGVAAGDRVAILAANSERAIREYPDVESHGKTVG